MIYVLLWFIIRYL